MQHEHATVQGRYASYEIGSLVGKGGNACVYCGIDNRTGKPVAIKVTPTSGDDALLQWRNEVNMLVTLRDGRAGELGNRSKHSPHDQAARTAESSILANAQRQRRASVGRYVVRYVDDMQIGSHLYTVMEYASRGSLQTYLQKQSYRCCCCCCASCCYTCCSDGVQDQNARESNHASQVCSHRVLPTQDAGNEMRSEQCDKGEVGLRDGSMHRSGRRTCLQPHRAGVPESTVVQVMFRLTRALAALHRCGVAHRDLKCANVLRFSRGALKLTDFGIATHTTSSTHMAKGKSVHAKQAQRHKCTEDVAACHDDTDNACASSRCDGSPQGEKTAQMARRESEAAEHTSDVASLGSIYWLAPESARGEDKDLRSDVWALGCVCVELLTGRPPFFDKPAVHALYTIAQLTTNTLHHNVIRTTLDSTDATAESPTTETTEEIDSSTHVTHMPRTRDHRARVLRGRRCCCCSSLCGRRESMFLSYRRAINFILPHACPSEYDVCCHNHVACVAQSDTSHAFSTQHALQCCCRRYHHPRDELNSMHDNTDKGAHRERAGDAIDEYDSLCATELSSGCRDFLRCCFAVDPAARASAETLLHHYWFADARMRVALEELRQRRGTKHSILHRHGQQSHIGETHTSSHFARARPLSMSMYSDKEAHGQDNHCCYRSMTDGQCTHARQSTCLVDYSHSSYDSSSTSCNSSSSDSSNVSDGMSDADELHEPHGSIAQWIENSLFLQSATEREMWMRRGGVLDTVLSVLSLIRAEESYSIVRSLAYAAQRCRSERSSFLHQLGRSGGALWGQDKLDILCVPDDLATIYICCCEYQSICVACYTPTDVRALDFLLHRCDAGVAQRCLRALHTLLVTRTVVTSHWIDRHTNGTPCVSATGDAATHNSNINAASTVGAAGGEENNLLAHSAKGIHTSTASSPLLAQSASPPTSGILREGQQNITTDDRRRRRSSNDMSMMMRCDERHHGCALCRLTWTRGHCLLRSMVEEQVCGAFMECVEPKLHWSGINQLLDIIRVVCEHTPDSEDVEPDCASHCNGAGRSPSEQTLWSDPRAAARYETAVGNHGHAHHSARSNIHTGGRTQITHITQKGHDAAVVTASGHDGCVMEDDAACDDPSRARCCASFAAENGRTAMYSHSTRQGDTKPLHECARGTSNNSAVCEDSVGAGATSGRQSVVDEGAEYESTHNNARSRGDCFGGRAVNSHFHARYADRLVIMDDARAAPTASQPGVMWMLSLQEACNHEECADNAIALLQRMIVYESKHNNNNNNNNNTYSSKHTSDYYPARLTYCDYDAQVNDNHRSCPDTSNPVRDLNWTAHHRSDTHPISSSFSDAQETRQTDSCLARSGASVAGSLLLLSSQSATPAHRRVAALRCLVRVHNMSDDAARFVRDRNGGLPLLACTLSRAQTDVALTLKCRENNIIASINANNSTNQGRCGRDTDNNDNNNDYTNHANSTLHANDSLCASGDCPDASNLCIPLESMHRGYCCSCAQESFTDASNDDIHAYSCVDEKEYAGIVRPVGDVAQSIHTLLDSDARLGMACAQSTDTLVSALCDGVMWLAQHELTVCRARLGTDVPVTECAKSAIHVCTRPETSRAICEPYTTPGKTVLQTQASKRGDAAAAPVAAIVDENKQGEITSSRRSRAETAVKAAFSMTAAADATGQTCAQSTAMPPLSPYCAPDNSSAATKPRTHIDIDAARTLDPAPLSILLSLLETILAQSMTTGGEGSARDVIRAYPLTPKRQARAHDDKVPHATPRRPLCHSARMESKGEDNHDGNMQEGDCHSSNDAHKTTLLYVLQQLVQLPSMNATAPNAVATAQNVLRMLGSDYCREL